MQNTIKTLRASIRKACDTQGRPLYDEREVRSIIDVLLEEVCALSRLDRVLHPDYVLPSEQSAILLQIADKMEQGIPMQQALGYERFCGERFLVTPDVLIPRPETAELVSWIVSDCLSRIENEGCRTSESRALNILDVGTGSGCIALSLARLINNSRVFAADVSTAALAVARKNSFQQGVDNVQFALFDILSAVDNSSESRGYQPLSTGFSSADQHDCQQALSTGYPQSFPPSFDVVVSNPPYICQREVAEMSDLVLQHEPSMALFVPDQDPLLFYRAIALFSTRHLVSGGSLYFEINAAYGQEVCDLLRDMGFHDVELRQDVNGRDRMVKASFMAG